MIVCLKWLYTGISVATVRISDSSVWLIQTLLSIKYNWCSRTVMSRASTSYQRKASPKFFCLYFQLSSFGVALTSLSSARKILMIASLLIWAIYTMGIACFIYLLVFAKSDLFALVSPIGYATW